MRNACAVPAIHLFTSDQVTLGRAAELAGYPARVLNEL